MYIPKDIILQIIEFQPYVDIEFRRVTTDWKNVCEKYIISQMIKTFDLDYDDVEIEIENAKKLDDFDISRHTSENYQFTKNYFSNSNFNDVFQFQQKFNHDFKLKIKLKHSDLKIKSRQFIFKTLKDENETFIEKIIKTNVLFFENILDFKNFNYFIENHDASMFNFKLLFSAKNPNQLLIQLYQYNLENKEKIKQKLNESHHLLYLINDPLQIEKQEPVYSIELEYHAPINEKNRINYSFNNQKKEPLEFTYENLIPTKQIVLKEKQQMSFDYSRHESLCIVESIEPALNNVIFSLGCSTINMNQIFENQLNMLKNICCVSKKYFEKHQNIIDFCQK